MLVSFFGNSHAVSPFAQGRIPHVPKSFLDTTRQAVEQKGAFWSAKRGFLLSKKPLFAFG
jgi:hypothetical protein